ncbi:MAG: carboxylesterase family protein [Pseudomonadota bacterium]
MTIIQTRLGAVEGNSTEGLQTYLGLPFAAPPINDQRWKSPQPAAPWTGTFDATQYPNRCYQNPYDEVLGFGEVHGEESEDCLYLNIYTPAADNKRRPVLCWIHGGAYFQGAASDYDGSVIAREQDVVVVAINYRLGVFGFCNMSALGPDYAGSVNRGFEDQIAALRWIRDNITDYGGDPNCVTIWGESAGAGSVLALQGAPAADGLYHRSIAFSGGHTGSHPPPDGVALLGAHFGKTENVGEALLAMPAEQLKAAQMQGAVQPTPCVDGQTITRSGLEAIAGKGADGPPLIIGCCRDEGTFLGPMVGTDPKVLAMVQGLYAVAINLDAPGDYLAFLEEQYADAEPSTKMERTWFHLFRSETLRAAETATTAGAGGWVYNFEVPTDNPLGITHGSDIPFTFNHFAGGASGLFFHEQNDANRALADIWSASMVQFARTGDPNGAGLPAWPSYEKRERNCLIFDAEPHIAPDPDGPVVRKAYGIES